MTARTVLTTFYGIDIKTHNDPYIALMEGPLEEWATTMTGIPGLVVRLYLCLYLASPSLSLPVSSLLPVILCHSIC